jgi:SMP-30/Gluconolactonase/LRE-like region
MHHSQPTRWATAFLLLPILDASPLPLQAQDVIPFDSPRWQHVNSDVTEIDGRQALQGVATLPDVDFRDGVIEYDLYLTGARSYPGIYFRLTEGTEGNDAEHFYVRPHRAGLYPDALQYTPVVNGIDEWQLHNGEGYTAPGVFTEGEWIPVRVEVKGTQARVFVEDMEEPALIIPYLEGDQESGSLAVTGPKDGSAYFSRFRYSTDVELEFDPAVEREVPEGMVRSWSVSPAIPVERVRRESYPGFYSIFLTDWQEVEADARGLVDVADRTARENPSGDLVLARYVFRSAADRVVNLAIGYSDEIDVFFNGRRVFSGQSRYRGRDPSFLGILGLHDQVPVQARKGLNEILLMVTEVFGGWGFMVQADGDLSPKPMDHAATEEVWMTPDTFLTPETVLKDPIRDILYVTNFDNQFAAKPGPSGFISRLGMDGEVVDLKWVEGLNAPTGMAIWRDTLFVAEREHLVAIHIPSGTVAGRWPIPDPDFPNDVAIDDDGTIYISDTRSGDWNDSRIYRFRDGSFDIFANEGISRANGLWIHDGGLIVGNSGDGLLKRVDLETGRITTVLSLGAGTIDGMRVDPDGNTLVSHWEGQLYRITPEGGITEILDAMPGGWNVADFEYLPEERLLVIPTFLDNRVRAVRILR